MKKIHYVCFWIKNSFNSHGNKIARTKIIKGCQIKFVLGALIQVLPRAPDGVKTALSKWSFGTEYYVRYSRVSL